MSGESTTSDASNPGTPAAATLDPEQPSRGPRRHARFLTGSIVAVGACVLLLLWSIVFVTIQTEHDAAIEHARVEAENLSAAFKAEVAGKLDATMRIMDFISDRIRTDPAFDLFDWAHHHRRLTSAVMLSAWFLAPDGVRIASTRGPDLPRIDLSDRTYYEVHRDKTVTGTYIGQLAAGRVSGETGIRISRRVDTPDGRFLGVLVFSLVPDHLTVLHKSANIGKRGILTVIGSDDITRARFSADGELKSGEKVPPRPVSEQDGHTIDTFIRASAIDGVVRLYSTRLLDPYPLRVSVGFDMTEVLTSAVVHAHQIKAVAFLATLILCGLLVLLIREIRRRTDREAKLAEEIAYGTTVQRRLRSSEARLRHFAEMASDWFWEQDEALRFTEIGAQAPLPASGKRSPIGNRRWELADTTDDPRSWNNHKRDLLAHRPFRDFHYSFIDGDGKRAHVSVNGTPVFDESGTFRGYRGTGRDVSADVETAATLRRSRDEADTANRAKSAFLANMSHELRTPLNAIIGFAELIHAKAPARTVEQCAYWAGDILSSGLHLLHVLNDIIALSRIEAGRYSLAEDKVDAGQTIRAAIVSLRPRMADNGVAIDCAIGDGGLVLRADKRAIQQILLNVVSNAVKFSPDGGVVTIQAEAVESGTAIVVSDTGIGIDPAALASIGEPFTQADSTIGRRYSGTGLGLTISRKLAELHGGRLTIDSMPGRGTTVRIVFSAERVMAQQAAAPAA